MRKRFLVNVEGRVQGVGFRPTVYRYAVEHGLSGFVKNVSTGVSIEVEGDEKSIKDFLCYLKYNPPEQARIAKFNDEEILVKNERGFEIIQSQHSEDLAAGMPPDLAVCERCRSELFAPDNRRFKYPFINCTNCGPRFTIIQDLPYDRERTSMSSFKMCSVCSSEYNDPMNRRFDAQPNACPDCGPVLNLIDSSGNPVSGNPLSVCVQLILDGNIVAVKGLGGYHLCCSATNDNVIRKLRDRKKRPHKALAVMFESIGEIIDNCEINETEKHELLSYARPIVVLSRKDASNVSKLVSPDTNDIGAFLPYTPLHYILLSQTEPLVMTSGNMAEEPIVCDEADLKNVLSSIADYALVHNRPILRRCDDSVLRIVETKRLFYRRSRGFVPDPVKLGLEGPSVLACGGELKNTFSVTRGKLAFISQHIGDLDDYRSFMFFRKSVDDLLNLLEIDPEIIAFDMHPGYWSTKYALESGVSKKVPVQHHHAHIVSCMAENGVENTVIGVAMDGSGYGDDGTVWGGEFLIADTSQYRRAAHFKQYPLPGNDEGIFHPLRMAFSVIVSEFGSNADLLNSNVFSSISYLDREVLLEMIEKGIRSPLTSSAGRLFDAVSAILGFSGRISYEGQAAICLQNIAKAGVNENYSYSYDDKGAAAVVSFASMFKEIFEDIFSGIEKSCIAAKFHNTIAAAITDVCVNIRNTEEINKVVLSGGVFQNDLLLKLTVNCLNSKGFTVYSHSIVPPNDGGIALGQAVVALAKSRYK
ncbi:MAG: carbamoyltransferase HypF [Candidatus Theseobacter exili]|nr:carbamoyltransferase HypF [Candidatus Theseobacter exili]